MVLAAGALAPAALAQIPSVSGTLQLYQGSYSYDVGGEFTAISSAATGTPALLPPYQYTGSQVVESISHAGLGFETFCVQTDVGFWPGDTYSYSGASLKTLGSPQANIPLSVGVAWLYAEFSQGTLGGYDYANSGTHTSFPTTTTAGLSATRETDAGALQAAIWSLMGESEPDGSFPTPTTANNLFYAEALSHFGSLSAATASVTTATYGDYTVGILNLTGSHGEAQNQLIWFDAPAPDGGLTLALLALSLAGLAVVARGWAASQRAL